MQRLITLIFELALVAVSVLSSDIVQENINFIPRAIVHLPEVDYSRDDFWIIFTYFIVVHFAVFVATQILTGVWEITSAKRTADEMFALAAAFAVATLLVFVTTNVNFDANFVVGIAIFNVLFFLTAYLIARLKTHIGPGRSSLNLLRSLFKRQFSIPGILILLLALTPGILAKVFVSNRDVANLITQTRIYFSSNSNLEYSLVSATGDERFLQPMQVKAPDLLPSELYVLERAGKILKLANNDSGLAEVVLDIRDKVGYVEVENGALGFDFHPQYNGTSNQRIYCYYTDVRDNTQINHLSAFDLSGETLQLRSESEQPLLEISRGNSGFHNGGSVEFGPDGFLYVALGEGLRTAEHKSAADTLRMGIIRIDVDQRGGESSRPIQRRPKNGETANYFIPLDNPFLDNPDILEEYWALGLRNPFRFSIDPVTRQIWAGDVGSTKWEEVNRISRGGNYQFPFVEGDEATGRKKPSPLFGDETGPVYTYFHTAYNRAVIGGIVYRGDLFPELKGQYLFADNYASVVYEMDATKDKISEVREIAKAAQFAQRGISSLTALADGQILVTTLGRSSEGTGEILKLVHGKTSPPKDAPLATPVALSDAEVREIFAGNCSRCHGATGGADGPDTALLQVEIADFSTPEFKRRSDQHLRATIRKGGAAMNLSPLMPPWEGLLSDAEIDGLVKYIRSM